MKLYILTHMFYIVLYPLTTHWLIKYLIFVLLVKLVRRDLQKWLQNGTGSVIHQ